MVRQFLASLRIAAVFVIFSFSVPFIAHPQEVDEPIESTQVDATNDDSAEQLENTFKEIGVSPVSDKTDESMISWTDRITGLFSSSSNHDSASGTDDAPKDGSLKVTSSKPKEDVELPHDTSINQTEPVPDVPFETETPATADMPPTDNVSTLSIETIPPEPTLETAIVTPLSLDEILREVTQTSHSREEAIYARLEEKRRMAVALRSTLQAAEEIAAYGEASTQLIHDASLDTIVSTMIAAKERERVAPELPSVEMPHLPPVQVQQPVDEPNDDDLTGFDAWQFVYIVEDSRGKRIGWRHRLSGERLTTYIGETSMFDGDAVKVVGFSNDIRGRFLILDVDGEAHEIHLF